jgi:hypothetical protein
VTEPEITTVMIETAGHLAKLSFAKPVLEPAAAVSFERWMLAQLKEGITELIEERTADGEPWRPGCLVAVPVVLATGEYVCGVARVVDGDPTTH